ncbi:MAG: endonuclease III [Deltaproteobacteria bacterium]|nr:endonuclease III [Deltaproteobacteria bacterium]
MGNNIHNFNRIWTLLQAEYPDAAPELHFNDPLQLLVATILSAQCTDAQVNKATDVLFKKYKTVEDFANADICELEKDIYSTGFYRNKAKNIKKSAQIIISDFDSRIPDTMEHVLTLPGVARKTANIVLARGHGVVEGIAVDTHVKRLSNLLGFTENTDPVKIERDLTPIFVSRLCSTKKHTIFASKPDNQYCFIREYTFRICSIHVTLKF